MRDIIQLIIAMMKRMLWFAVAVIVIVTFTVINISSIDTISNNGLPQYFRNIYQLQLWDVQYKALKPLKVYDEPQSLNGINFQTLTLQPGTCFSVTGIYTPSGEKWWMEGEVSWFAIKVYRGDQPIYGYILSPDNGIGIFGGYTGDNKYFESFSSSDEKFYKVSLEREFYRVLTNKYRILLLTDNIKKQILIENGTHSEITKWISTDMIKDHAKNTSAEYFKLDYFCHKSDYEKVKVLYKSYFDSDEYENRLTQI